MHAQAQRDAAAKPNSSSSSQSGSRAASQSDSRRSQSGRQGGGQGQHQSGGQPTHHLTASTSQVGKLSALTSAVAGQQRLDGPASGWTKKASQGPPTAAPVTISANAFAALLDQDDDAADAGESRDSDDGMSAGAKGEEDKVESAKALTDLEVGQAVVDLCKNYIREKDDAVRPNGGVVFLFVLRFADVLSFGDFV